MNGITEDIKEQARTLATANDDITEADLISILDVDFETASILIEMLQDEGKIKKIEIKKIEIKKTEVNPQNENSQDRTKDYVNINTTNNCKKDKGIDYFIYMSYIFIGIVTALSFFNSMMYLYTHLQIWFIFVLPLCFVVAAIAFFASSLLVSKICFLRCFPIVAILIAIPFSIFTYFMYEYTENLKIEIATNNEIERIERTSKYKSKEYAKKDCDKQGAQEAIDMIVNGGLAERQNNPDSVIVWYIWKDNWYGFSKEQRYQLTSGIGGAEKCLTGKAIRIRVGDRDVAKSTLTGNVELMD